MYDDVAEPSAGTAVPIARQLEQGYQLLDAIKLRSFIDRGEPTEAVDWLFDPSRQRVPAPSGEK